MIGIIILTSVAFILSIIIVFSSNKIDFVSKIIELLPQYNCGRCGYSNCEDMAHHILENKENVKKCPFMKEENIEKINQINN